MFLLDSGKFAANPESVANHITELLEKAGASVVSHRPWQDGKLAYELSGHRKGLHYLTYFRMEGAGLTQVARSVKLSDQVIRHLVIRHPQKLFDAMVAALDGDEVSASAADATKKTVVETKKTVADDVSTDADEPKEDDENSNG